MTQEHHEPKHPAVHVEITGENKGETTSFALAEDDPARRNHIPENDNPMPPKGAGAGAEAEVPGELNASETSRDEVNGAKA